MYAIEIVPDALNELNSVPVFYRRIIEQAVESQLTTTPSVATKNRKSLQGLAPGFEYEEPLWELRVADWRVFYDVNEEEQRVIIRAVRPKQKGQTIKEII